MNLCCGILYCALVLLGIASLKADLSVESIFSPDNCESLHSGDHLLIEFEFFFSNGTAGLSMKKPGQLFHLVLEDSVRLSLVCLLPMFIISAGGAAYSSHFVKSMQELHHPDGMEQRIGSGLLSHCRLKVFLF